MILKAKLLAVPLLAALTLAGLLVAANAAYRSRQPAPRVQTAAATDRRSALDKADEVQQATPRARSAPRSTTPSPQASLNVLRSAVAKKDWRTFQQYVDEKSVVDSFVNKVDRDGLRLPGGRVMIRGGLDPLTRALIGRVALSTLRRVVRGQAVASGVNGSTVNRALDSMRVRRIVKRGRTATVTMTSGRTRRAVLKMRLVRGRWQVVEIEDYATG